MIEGGTEDGNQKTVEGRLVDLDLWRPGLDTGVI